jgi:alpha-amylase
LALRWRRVRALLASSILLAACSGPDGLELRTHVADWRDQIVYQIVVDRFEDGDLTNDEVDGIATDPSDLARFQGGDWRGVIDRLDYLEELGVTALWISPPYRNVQRTEEEDGYHGYWPADFTEANPRFGSIEDLRELVSSAHERGMLVILDVVPNHAGRVFSYDLDGDGTIGEGEIEPAYSVDGPYEVPLVFTEAPRAHLGNEIIALGPSHFHRRGDGDLADPIQRELGDFPTGLRDLDTENP